MARAKTKEELISQADDNFIKLFRYIDSMSEQALNTEFDFSDDKSKKESHWSRDRNLRDVLIHLYEWHQLLLNWVNSNMSGQKAAFLPPPYNWKTYGQMNIEFWQKHQQTELLTAKALLQESHKAALEVAKNFTNEELYTKQYFDWTGTTTLGSYCVSAMPSHYDWALKKLRAHAKMQS
ncbi:ClbS/DfsB family four-helix bundle protein [Vibrio sp. 99-8-1]|uniref:ClbS/DfsB family four-helix bundle protein n=1 Tax=Vibrio sp. 99-8-1 TaxID=2607602 RepID=UPI00149333F8|nr:ClbS/DfsB family four-helix bundle protein [Vibrio sp. 99-8-1]NOI65148.1 ClbS/DfsB family four-helix bundle protein [Vibrio sp. 99-8-1]